MDPCGLGNKVIRRLVVVALASFLLASATISFAEEAKNFRYGLEGNNLVFTTPEQATQGGSFRLAVTDGQRANISVELVDLVSNSSGAKQPIPLNSSPFTPNGLVEFTTSYPVYEPSTEFQYFDIAMKFREGIALDRPVLGGIQISLVPETPSKDKGGVVSSIVATFAYLPATGLNLEQYAPGLTLSGPKIDRRTPDFFPLNLLPNLPFVLNHGDLTLGYQLTNTGKIFLETTTNRLVEQVGLFGEKDKKVFSDSKKAFLVPEQFSEDTTDVKSTDSKDQLLGIGIYRFTVTATGKMGDQIETSTSNQQTLIIFPWKQCFLGLLLLVAFRRRIGRGVKWFIDLGKAFIDFRNSRRPASNPEPKSGQAPSLTQESSSQPEPTLNPEPKPSLTSKLTAIARRAFAKIRAIKLKPKKMSIPRLSLKTSKAKPADSNSTIRSTAPAARSNTSSSVPTGFEVRPLYPKWYQPSKKSD